MDIIFAPKALTSPDAADLIGLCLSVSVSVCLCVRIFRDFPRRAEAQVTFASIHWGIEQGSRRGVQKFFL